MLDLKHSTPPPDRSVPIAIFANLLAGFVVGILARIVMYLLTITGGLSDTFPPRLFTVFGTLRILATPILVKLLEVRQIASKRSR